MDDIIELMTSANIQSALFTEPRAASDEHKILWYGAWYLVVNVNASVH